jgi:hypothetical protein
MPKNSRLVQRGNSADRLDLPALPSVEEALQKNGWTWIETAPDMINPLPIAGQQRL